MKIISNDDVLKKIVQQEKIQSKKITLRAGEETRLQNHLDIEFWVVHSGKAILYTQQKYFTIFSGMQVFFDPFDDHHLKNISSADFIFTAYWYICADKIEDKTWTQLCRDKDEFLIGAAFPTPNGPLHLGHLIGPYFLSDIVYKTSLLFGQDSKFYCGTFGHQNHIDRTAAFRNISYDELVHTSEKSIQEVFYLFGLRAHSFLTHYPISVSYKESRDTLIDALLKSPYLIKETVELPFDDDEQCFVTESYVSGKCPYCNSITIGIECENCGLFQDESFLIEPFHTESKKILSKKSTERWYVLVDKNRLDHIRSLLYSEQTETARFIVHQLDKFFAKNLLNKIPVSTIRNRGISFIDKQKLSIPVERALRSLHALLQFPTTKKHLFFCGIDNLCASGIYVPYILYIIGIKSYQLPIIYITQLARLDGQKFSTSRNHMIEASSFLEKYNPEILRAYFASINHPKIKSEFSVKNFYMFSTSFIEELINIFKIGNSLFLNYKINRTEVEAGDWLKEDKIFYKNIKENLLTYLNYIFIGETQSALTVYKFMLSLLHEYLKITSFIDCERDPHLFRTRFVLIIYSYRSICFALFPIMPDIISKIMSYMDTSIDSFQEHITTISSIKEIHFESAISLLHEILDKLHARNKS